MSLKKTMTGLLGKVLETAILKMLKELKEDTEKGQGNNVLLQCKYK